MNTIERITHILYTAKIPYQFDQQNSRIGLFLTLKTGEEIPFTIDTREGGSWLDICAPNLLQVKDSVFKGVVFQTLLTIAWETPIIRYFHNPNNASISASIDLPLLDMTITDCTLISCLTLMANSLVEAIPRLRHVLATGTDPGRKSYLEQLVEQMPSDSLTEMAKLIQLRQQQNGSNS